MIPPKSTMPEELKFPHRWEFRMTKNDFDSSSNDSKSSGDAALKKFQLFSSLVPVVNDETDDISRIQQKGNCGPSASGEKRSRKAPTRRRGRSKKDDSSVAEAKRSSRRVVSRKKMKPSANENDVLNDLRKYMNSLLDDLLVTREGLIVWMRQEIQKLAAEEGGPVSKTKEGSLREQKVELQPSNKSLQNTEVQCQNISGKNFQIQQKNFKDHEQLEPPRKAEKNVQLQQNVGFKDHFEVQHQQQNIQQHHWNNFMPWTRVQDYSAGTSAEKFYKSKKQGESSGKPAPELQADFSQAIVPIPDTGNRSKEILTFSRKSKSKTSPLEQNVQEQQEPKSIVLAIRAQNSNVGSSKRSSRGKKTANSKHQPPSTEDQIDYTKAIVSIPPDENDTASMLQLSAEAKFSSNSSYQVPASMYMTPPNFLSHIPSYGLETSSLKSTQPRIAANQTAINPERSSLLLGPGPGSHHGYIMGFQPEERNGTIFPDMESRYKNFFNNNIAMTSLIGNGFQVPFHQALNGSFNIPSQVSFENLHHQEVNNSPLSLRMAGAIRYLGSSQASPADQYIVNNFHGHPCYKADGNLMPFQDGYQFPGPHS